MGRTTAELLGHLLAGDPVDLPQLLHAPGQHGLWLTGHQMRGELWPRHGSKDCRLVNNSGLAQACFETASRRRISKRRERVVSSHQPPSWERIIAWLVVAAISLQVLAGVLPRLLPALVVLAAVIAVLRLIWWYTQL